VGLHPFFIKRKKQFFNQHTGKDGGEEPPANARTDLATGSWIGVTLQIATNDELAPTKA
jgi:hypothetical protein